MSESSQWPRPVWTDRQLTEAIASSTNWRSVMRRLGFGDRSGSAGAIRIVRRRAVALDLDWSHFRGKRRWSDEQLRQAVTESGSWDEVITRIGLATGSGNVQPHVKSPPIRLGLDTSHLNAITHTGRQPPEEVPRIASADTDRKHLRTAGPVTAAAWFMLRGCAVSFPI